VGLTATPLGSEPTGMVAMTVSPDYGNFGAHQ
jgi:hypothetical protein